MRPHSTAQAAYGPQRMQDAARVCECHEGPSHSISAAVAHHLDDGDVRDGMLAAFEGPLFLDAPQILLLSVLAQLGWVGGATLDLLLQQLPDLIILCTPILLSTVWVGLMMGG